MWRTLVLIVHIPTEKEANSLGKERKSHSWCLTGAGYSKRTFRHNMKRTSSPVPSQLLARSFSNENSGVHHQIVYGVLGHRLLPSLESFCHCVGEVHMLRPWQPNHFWVRTIWQGPLGQVWGLAALPSKPPQSHLTQPRPNHAILQLKKPSPTPFSHRARGTWGPSQSSPCHLASPITHHHHSLPLWLVPSDFYALVCTPMQFSTFEFAVLSCWLLLPSSSPKNHLFIFQDPAQITPFLVKNVLTHQTS